MLVVHPLEIIVLESTRISNATATITLDLENRSKFAEYDSDRELYFFPKPLSPGFYSVMVQVKNLETVTRIVQVHPRPTREIFKLVPPNKSYFLRGKNRIAYKRQPKFIGAMLTFDSVLDEQFLDELAKVPGSEVVYYSTPDSKWQRATQNDLQLMASNNSIQGIRLKALVVRRKDLEATSWSKKIESLLNLSFVRDAGPIAKLDENSFAIFTDEIIIRFRAEVSLEKRSQSMEKISSELQSDEPNNEPELQLEIVHEINHIPNGVLVRLSKPVDDTTINKIVQDLVNLEDPDKKTNLVEFAEPVIKESSNPDSVKPKDYLWPSSWDRKLVNVEDAWCSLGARRSILAFGSPDVVVGIVDELPSKDGIVQHPDLNTTVSNHLSKVCCLYDFENMRPDHDKATGGHGLMVASVAVASAKTDGPLASGGTCGVAPNVRLVGAIPSGPRENILIWLAGLEVNSSKKRFPPPPRLEAGCAIMCWAAQLDGNGIPSDPAEDAMKYVTRRGRNGKGCLIFFSAGNMDIENFRANSWCNSQFSLACAASTLNSDDEEIRANYSNHSKYGYIEWCAPSSGPDGRSVWAATNPGLGDLPSSETLKTVLTKKPEIGKRCIWVQSIVGMFAHMSLLIGGPEVPNEVVKIGAGFDGSSNKLPLKNPIRKEHFYSENDKTVVVSGMNYLTKTSTDSLPRGTSSLNLKNLTNSELFQSRILSSEQRFFLIVKPDETDFVRETITLEGAFTSGQDEIPFSPKLKLEYPPGSLIVEANNGHTSSFGQTSSAAPLCAGIAALVLSANSQLTWVEVREILRTTARKIDPYNSSPKSRWFDRSGVPCVKSGREPHISGAYGYGRLDADAAVKAALKYKCPRDLMIRNSLADDGSKKCSSNANSPDIWVRHKSPHEDEGELPMGFAEAGPHQQPISESDCWIYVRVSNRGTEPSLDAWVRLYIASYQNRDFKFPEDWEHANEVRNISSNSWQPGTFFIGEVALPAIEHEPLIIYYPWSSGLIPPQLTPEGNPWNPRLLVEISPQDGPLEGNTIENNNNLAEKSLEIAY